MNFLEALAAEWYSWRGYFVRTNLKFGKRQRGGWEGEMDVVAFRPTKRELVHIETSMDGDRWKDRKKRLQRKFEAAEKHWDKLFSFEIQKIQRIAVVGYSRSGNKGRLGRNIEVKSLPQFVAEICRCLQKTPPLKRAIPETLPHLRAMQFAVHWGSSSTATVAPQHITMRRTAAKPSQPLAKPSASWRK